MTNPLLCALIVVILDDRGGEATIGQIREALPRNRGIGVAEILRALRTLRRVKSIASYSLSPERVEGRGRDWRDVTITLKSRASSSPI